jgi:hypothetical protein
MQQIRSTQFVEDENNPERQDGRRTRRASERANERTHECKRDLDNDLEIAEKKRNNNLAIDRDNTQEQDSFAIVCLVAATFFTVDPTTS